MTQHRSSADTVDARKALERLADSKPMAFLVSLEAEARIDYAKRMLAALPIDEPQTPPDRQKLIDLIGYHLASALSGNNQPDMSGDPRKRIPPIRRRHFDDACAHCADAILALSRPQQQGPTT